VEVGDQVVAGQVIALSGNSGLSRGPHLHSSVKTCPEGAKTGGPACVSAPVTFRNTRGASPWPHRIPDLGDRWGRVGRGLADVPV